MLATTENFIMCLVENPIGLHFSGHGIENQRKRCEEGNFLVFEDNQGCAHFVSERQLKDMLKSSG